MYQEIQNTIFNPRLREGGDKAIIDFDGESIIFNPRLREGGDKSLSHHQAFFLVFNPRLREGGDNDPLNSDSPSCFSIHASAKEATVAF